MIGEHLEYDKTGRDTWSRDTCTDLSVRHEPVRDPLLRRVRAVSVRGLGVRPAAAALAQLRTLLRSPRRAGRRGRSTSSRAHHALDVLADPPEPANVPWSNKHLSMMRR